MDPSKVRCLGPGLGSGVRAHIPQTFTVDSSRAGVAPLEVQLYGPSGETSVPLSDGTGTGQEPGTQSDVEPVMGRLKVHSGSCSWFLQGRAAVLESEYFLRDGLELTEQLWVFSRCGRASQHH